MRSLRFITAGNVDDGKSTLIGRLLYDSRSIHTDQLGILQQQTRQQGNGIDLSLVTDGLRAEREQGITIDVAYKYFTTQRRKFIIADAPGHEQYTRNMVTGASNSELIIILVDARKGITQQTRRHARIGSLMGIRKAIVAVNKIDLVNYSETVFNTIQKDFEALYTDLQYDEVIFLPISALAGDNIVQKSENTPWYQAKPLLEILEDIEIPDALEKASRFQVQWVIRPKEEQYHDYRGFAGPVLSGRYAVGEKVRILPGGFETVITGIEKHQQQVEEAFAGDNVVLHFRDEIDISRGSTIVRSGEDPVESTSFSSWISWLDHTPLQQGKTYILQHRFRSVRVKIQEIQQKWNVSDSPPTDTDRVVLNDIAKVSLRTNQPLFFDSFSENPRTGNGILIDETNYNTVGALMIDAN